MNLRALNCVALVALSSSASAQTIATFADVAGKWSGISSLVLKMEVEIATNGQFRINVPGGKDVGWSQLVGGVLIVPFSDKQGQYEFKWNGSVLEGQAYWRTIETSVRLTKKAR